MRLLLQGHSQEQVIAHLKDRSVRRPGAVLNAAMDRFAAVAGQSREVRLGFLQEAVLLQYQRLHAIGLYADALKALQELAKLTDAYNAAKELPGTIVSRSGKSPAGVEREPDNAELLKLVKGDG